MSPPPSSGHLLPPFDDHGGEEVCPGGAAASDPADYVRGWGADDFYVRRRIPGSGSNESGRDRLRIAESDPDTDTDEQIAAIEDPDLPFCWECLHVDDDGGDPIDEFDWEDVSGRSDDREIFTLMPFAGDTTTVENTNPNPEEGDDAEMNVDWEFLLAANQNDDESVSADDEEGFSYASEYDDLYNQLVGGAEWSKCGRPAARSVLENLPSVQLTQDYLSKEDIHCAVCKDEISLSDEVKGLPCLHYYHENCIVPWLVVRNTCPLCRYELPSTDSNEAATVEGDEFEILQAI